LETIININPVLGLVSKPVKCNKPLNDCGKLAVVFDANDDLGNGFVKRYCSEHAADHEYLIRKLHKGGMTKFPDANWKVIPEQSIFEHKENQA
jgi:hypothetical protein